MDLKIFKTIGIALLYCGLFRLSFGFGGFIKNAFPDEYYWFALGGFGTVSILIITWIFLRIEKNSFGEIGLKWEAKTPKRFVVGLLIGIGIATAMLLIIINFAGLQVELANNYEVSSFLFWSLAFIPLAFMEEVAFRSYPFLKLNKVVGLRLTQVIIAIFFAFYHYGEGPVLSVFVGPGVWAFVYGMAAVLSKGIALPTGLHFGANFILASIGDKTGVDPIWIIEYINEATPEMIARTETISTLMQLVLLIGAVLAMERYIRNKE